MPTFRSSQPYAEVATSPPTAMAMVSQPKPASPSPRCSWQ